MSKRGVWLRHPLHLGKGYEHIQAGQLVKHLLVLPHGRQLAVAAEVATDYSVVEVRYWTTYAIWRRSSSNQLRRWHSAVSLSLL